MGYSFLTNLQLSLEIFESINEIKINCSRNKQEILIYLNNHFCDYETTINDLKKFLSKEELNFVRFIND